MSATNLTKNLKLPQFVASDKPSWLGDVNGAMLNIDNGIGEIKGDISKASDTASSAKSQSDANTVTLGNVNTELTNIGNRVTALEAGGGTEQLELKIKTLESDVESINTRADTFEEEIASNGTGVSNNKKSIDELTPRVKSVEDNVVSLTTTTTGLSQTVQSTSESVNTLQTSLTTTNRSVAKNSSDISNLQNTVATLGSGIASNGTTLNINGSNVPLNHFFIARADNAFSLWGFALSISSATIATNASLSFDTTGFDSGMSNFTTTTTVILFYTSGSASPTTATATVNFYSDTHTLNIDFPSTISSISSSGRPFIILNDTLA